MHDDPYYDPYASYDDLYETSPRSPRSPRSVTSSPRYKSSPQPKNKLRVSDKLSSDMDNINTHHNPFIDTDLLLSQLDTSLLHRPEVSGAVLAYAAEIYSAEDVYNALKEKKIFPKFFCRDVIEELEQYRASAARDIESYVEDGYTTDPRYYWAARFQACKYKADRDVLKRDFERHVKSIVKILILEKELPYVLKTIKPLNIGGIAGGVKYIVHSTMFKFAGDSEMINGKWLYGKDKPDDILAAKALNNELKALRALNQQQVSINLPLACIVNYLGHTIIAYSLLPISNKTLVLGSSDGCYTFHSQQEDDPTLQTFLSEVKNIYKLKEHRVYERSTDLEKNTLLAADVEIHKTQDNKLYAIDLAR